MSIVKSLKQSTSSLILLTKETAFKFPLFVIIFLGLVFCAIYFISSSPNIITLTVSILVGFLSIGIYAKNNSVSESMLTLILGLLTAFTINWTPATAIMFSAIFLSYTFSIFMFSCISLAAETEHILMNAAVHVSQHECKQVYDRLRQISDSNTPVSQLGPVERAIAIRFLVFMSVPYKEMSQALYTIGSMKIVYQISLEETLAFYRILYRIINLTILNGQAIDWDQIMSHLTSCPCPPNEFLEIISKSKSLVISGKVPFPRYLARIHELLKSGYDGDDLITQLHSTPIT